MGAKVEPQKLGRRVSTKGRKPKSQKVITDCRTSSRTSAVAADAYLQSCGIRASLVQPIRQTAPIFKQPVTIHRNHDSKVENNSNTDKTQERPKQIFWEKRLKSLNASDTNDCEIGGIKFIRRFKTITGLTYSKSILNADSDAYRNLE